MLRMLVEEYARMGWGAGAIMELARDPNYQAFHGLLQLFGEEEFRQPRVGNYRPHGVIRVSTTTETDRRRSVWCRLICLSPLGLKERRMQCLTSTTGKSAAR